MCIGANIGITPFISMLKSFLYQEPRELGEMNTGYKKDEEGEDVTIVQIVQGCVVKKVRSLFLFRKL